MTNDVQFEFIGFKPDQNIRNFVTTVAEKIYFGAPSDSAMKLVIEEGKLAIRASCRIASQAGTFMADTIGDTPIQAVQQIEGKMRDQLESWKKRRFENERSQ